jgi:putative FmdB family regulatory protein
MPNYDYECSQCSYKEEILQKMTEAPLTTCPQCKQTTFKRKFGGGIGLQFQGSGFYSTDYGSPSPSKEESKPSSPSKGCGCGKTSCNS